MERKNGEAIGRKIKELQIGNVRRDINQFLRFGQNTGIATHFTKGINGFGEGSKPFLAGEDSVAVV